ncbi:hypothetical protein GH714_038541 [Hevea brasiliensis]|uniref:Uncharacterized protein n=1 Tax=Hevea brasiliensis TaxID=3981 RepID=A0A6A6NAP6_HEVBR|nr:hypothetical protein GH714_038541 [Hevea brasiliensis]
MVIDSREQINKLISMDIGNLRHKILALEEPCFELFHPPVSVLRKRNTSPASSSGEDDDVEECGGMERVHNTLGTTNLEGQLSPSISPMLLSPIREEDTREVNARMIGTTKEGACAKFELRILYTSLAEHFNALNISELELPNTGLGGSSKKSQLKSLFFKHKVGITAALEIKSNFLSFVNIRRAWGMGNWYWSIVLNSGPILLIVDQTLRSSDRKSGIGSSTGMSDFQSLVSDLNLTEVWVRDMPIGMDLASRPQLSAF